MLASAAPCPLTNTSRASTCGLNSFLLIQVITIHHLLYYNHNFRYLIPKLIHFITGNFLKYSIKYITLIITFHTLPPHRYTYVVFRRHVLCRCGLQSNVLRFSGAALWSLSIVIITILQYFKLLWDEIHIITIYVNINMYCILVSWVENLCYDQWAIIFHVNPVS